MEARSRKLERWFTGGGVIFVGYDLFRNLVVGNRMKKKKKEAFMKYLLDPGIYIKHGMCSVYMCSVCACLNSTSLALYTLVA